MSRLRPSSNTLMRDYVWPGALGLAIVVCMPVLGLAAFLLRGVAVAVFAVVVAIATMVGIWHLIEPTLSPRWRMILREYAAPIALGVSVVVCMPLLAVVAFVVQGTVVALLAMGAVIVAIVGLWHLVARARDTFGGHSGRTRVTRARRSMRGSEGLR